MSRTTWLIVGLAAVAAIYFVSRRRGLSTVGFTGGKREVTANFPTPVLRA